MAKNEASLLIRIKQVGGEALDKIGSGLKTIGQVAGVVGTAIVSFGSYAVSQFKEAELASNQLSQSMVQQGVYTTELKSKYDKMAASLQAVTTYGDEQITTAQSLLQSYIGEKEVTEDLLKATMDLAAAKGMDLKNAADLVGKSIGSSTNALSRYGIEMDSGGDKTRKMADLVGKLNQKFGGQAAAAAQGLGAIDSLKNVASDFMEVVGQRLSPVVIGMANSLKTLILNIQESGSAMDMIMSVFQATAQIGVVVKGAFEAVGKTVGNVLAGIAGGMSDLIEGNFRSAWNNAKSIVTVSVDDMTEVWAKGKEDMAYLNELFLKGTEENLKKEEDLIRASNERKMEIAAEKKALDDEFFATKDAEELEKLALHEQVKSDIVAMAELQRLNAIINGSDSAMAKLQAQTQKEKIMKDQQAKLDIARMQGLAAVEAFLNSEKIKNTQTTLGTISSLQQSKSKELVAIGKAAAIAQALINTAQGVTLALATFPGPIGIAMGALVGVAGAAQIATIAGVGLAEGGLVRASPGGTPAIIGEGGRDEAVIPLDDPDTQERLGGMGGLTVNFNGSFLGDETTAMEVAKVLDRAFLRLRQSNQSVAFDSDVI